MVTWDTMSTAVGVAFMIGVVLGFLRGEDSGRDRVLDDLNKLQHKHDRLTRLHNVLQDTIRQLNHRGQNE